jgi:hypothetical protein
MQNKKLAAIRDEIISDCHCDASFSGYDEPEYRSRGCPSCTCDKEAYGEVYDAATSLLLPELLAARCVLDFAKSCITALGTTQIETGLGIVGTNFVVPEGNKRIAEAIERIDKLLGE